MHSVRGLPGTVRLFLQALHSLVSLDLVYFSHFQWLHKKFGEEKNFVNLLPKKKMNRTLYIKPESESRRLTARASK